MEKACITLPHTLSSKTVEISQTMLKDLITNLWNNCKGNNVLRYKVAPSRIRVVDGQYKFCADWNEHRFSNKRPSQKINSTDQPFDVNQFNFNNIKETEILCGVKVSEDAHCVNVSMDVGNSIISVNDSPLSENHVLLLHSPKDCLNQRLTKEAIELGLVYLISLGDPDTRVVFNSLRAFASINHLHLHAYQCNEALPIESVRVEHVSDCCYKLTEYPAPAFVFQLQSDTVHLAESIFVLIKLLQERDIPHNMMMSYGDPCDASHETSSAPQPVIRVIVWPVKPSDELPEHAVFRPAVCELSGDILLHDYTLYENITEQEIVDTLKMAAFERSCFEEIAEVLKGLLNANQDK